MLRTKEVLIKKNGTDGPICRAVLETQTLRTDLWAWRGKDSVERIEMVAFTFNTSMCKIAS